MTKNFKKILREEFASITPQQSERLKSTEIVAKKRKRRRLLLPICALISCCCCVLCLIFLLPTQNETYALASYISISFNPSLSLTIDDDGNVESLVAENYDAEIVLSGLSLSGAEVGGAFENVILDVVCQSQNLGFFEDVKTVYVEIFCFEQDSRALDLISEKIEATLAGAISGKEISISEMKKEDVLGKAKEIDQNIPDDIDAEKLHETLKGAPSYSQKLQEGIGEDKSGLLELFNLQILSCTMDAVESLQRNFQEILAICEQEGIGESEIFTSNNPRIEQLLEEYSTTLEWFGVQLSEENFGLLLENYSIDFEQKNSLEATISNFKTTGNLNLQSFDSSEILQNETIAQYHAWALQKHSISQDCSVDEILRAITELDAFARLNKFAD